MSRENGHRFFTVEQVCEALQVKREWVIANWGKLPMGGVKLNHKTLRFKREEFERWLATLEE